ncbi:proteinrelated to glucan 1, 4-alpha-glucosidase [Purpureocillium lavendulum]|uniref:Proteinrelated to glucan 1, 4-alpha-glucosidase n=1 Tax=Purpureocillium lavendulum TaxID=1247861 RepID=A0AB34FR03_9HYPO|nr:proteinrelated to glucan 1, 4-alpha-glucosidase [Purpureocillium lavendulum]
MASQGDSSTAKRPRLSLQIRTSSLSPSKGLRGYPVNPSDPTAFNTLSNAYVTAIERSSTAQSEPITAINTLQAFSIETPAEAKPRVFTPYVANYPETPLTALSDSPSQMEIKFPSTMTATPPLSATADASPAKVFTFSSSGVTSQQSPASLGSPIDGRVARRRLCATLGGALPYTHPRSLHSILRNSPLPPRTAIPPPSPRRQSLRLQEKAAKKVEYNNPLTQDIITNTYVKSHIDLLTDDASPNTPPLPTGTDTVLDVALSFTANEIRDGGQTPGPFEETRRRVAGLAIPQLPSPVENGGPRKRKRMDKKRQWRWTIGQDDDDLEGLAVVAPAASSEATKTTRTEAATPGAGVPQITYLETPTPSIESVSSFSEVGDVEMSDTSSVLSVDDRPTRERLRAPSETELDLKTPTAPSKTNAAAAGPNRDTPIPELSAKRDTPVPPELM